MKRLALVGAITIAAAAATPASAGQSCASAIKHVVGGANGPIVCPAANGDGTVIVVDRRVPLRLRTLTVRVTGVHLAKQLKNTVNGFVISHATAQGLFAVVKISIFNHTSQPQTFNPFSQDELLVANDAFTVSTTGETADTTADHLDLSVQPGEFVTGDVVFDVPTKLALADVPAHAALGVVNFGNDARYSAGNQIGLDVLR